MNIIAEVSRGASISMMFSILINNLMRMWVRFKENLYGDESYLTHTLPIEKKTLYLSKAITAIITLFVSVAVIGLTLFITYYSKENLEIIKNVLFSLADAYNSSIIKILLAVLLVFFLEFANILQAGYTGIILGHKKNNLKVGYSVLFGFIVYIITQIFVLLIIFIVGIFNKDIMNLFVTKTIINIDMIKLALYMAFLIYTAILFVGYFVNVKLFKKGVNVE